MHDLIIIRGEMGPESHERLVNRVNLERPLTGKKGFPAPQNSGLSAGVFCCPMKLNQLFKTTGETFTYYPSFVSRFGISVNACVFLCFIGWKTIPDALDEWRQFNVKDITDSTGLSVKEQTNARKVLVAKGLIKEHYARLDHVLKFRLCGFDLESGGESPYAQREDAPGGDTTNGSFPIRPKGVSTNDKELIKEPLKNMDSIHEPIAVWVREYGKCNEAKYNLEKKSRRNADSMSMRWLIKSGIKPERIVEVMVAMFGAVSSGQRLFNCSKCDTVENFCNNFNLIVKELKLSNGTGETTPQMSADEIAADEAQKKLYGSTW